jgi:hypothetical protein
LFRFQPDRTSPRRRSFAVAAAALCLVLVALLSVVQVAHVHPSATDADHCQLCIVLHAAAPAAVATALVILVQLGSTSPVVETRTAIRTWHPTLFTRPPPPGR